MPNVYNVGVQVTSTAVTSVNQTGEAMFGRPYVVRRDYGNIVYTQTNTNGTAIVTPTGFTHSPVQP